MNSTHILLGTTGFLLVIALVLSFGRMNQAKNANPQEIEELRREIARLEVARAKLEQKNNPSLIFTQSPYPSTTTPVKTVEADNSKLNQIQDDIAALMRENENLRESLTETSTPEPAIVEESTESSASSDKQARRARLINQALLQANVQQWSSEDWLAVIEPTGQANFNVGDELALRRNGGILCTFYVSRAVAGQYIADLKSNLATGAPDIRPGDELIIPLIYDGALD